MTLRNFRQKSYAPNTSLRGKIGPSLMNNRIINGMMDYMKSIQSGKRKSYINCYAMTMTMTMKWFY